MTLKHRLVLLGVVGLLGAVAALGARLHLLDARDRATALHVEADDAWHAGEYERAADAFGELQVIEPHNPEHFVDQAFAFRSLEDDARCLDAYARGMAQLPQDWYLPFHRGYQYFYRWKNDPVRGLEDLTLAATLTRTPEDTVAVLRQQANIEQVLEQWDALHATSERILALDPENAFAQRDLERVALVRAWAAGDHETVRAQIARLRARNPDDVLAADYARRLGEQ